MTTAVQHTSPLQSGASLPRSTIGYEQKCNSQRENGHSPSAHQFLPADRASTRCRSFGPQRVTLFLPLLRLHSRAKRNSIPNPFEELQAHVTRVQLEELA